MQQHQFLALLQYVIYQMLRQGAFRSATVAHDVSLNAYNLASRSLRKGLKTTAKAKAKKDALSRVGNQAATSAYKKAAQEATQAAKNANFVPSSKPLNIFVQSPRTGVLGKYTTIEQAAKNNMIRGRLVDNFIKKDIAEDVARKAVNKAGQKYGQAVSAYSEALRWRPLGIASAGFEVKCLIILVIILKNDIVDLNKKKRRPFLVSFFLYLYPSVRYILICYFLWI